MLSPTDHRRVVEAVAAAEAETRGEVVCVVTRQVSHYRETPLAVGVIIALALPPIILAAGFDPEPWLGSAEQTWFASRQAGDGDLASSLSLYALFQAILFIVSALIADLPPVRSLLTPKALKRQRVHRAALAQFAAAGLHTDETPGVVIFVSEAEHMVEVLGDQALHKAVGEAVFQAAVAEVRNGVKAGQTAEGLVRAVEICGAALKAHFPATETSTHHHDPLLEL